MIRTVATCAFALTLGFGTQPQREVIRLRDVQGTWGKSAFSPSAAHDWAARARIWFEKAKVVLSVIQTDTWHMPSGASYDALLASEKKQLEHAVHALDLMCGADGGAEAMVRRPYSLGLQENVLDVLNHIEDEFMALFNLSMQAEFSGGPSRELIPEIGKVSTEGNQLLLEYAKQREALDIWYETTAGYPSY